MPVEFRCTKCRKLLRTPDDSRGKQARCPECGTIATVPARPAPLAPPSALLPATGAAVAGPFPSGAASDNPYQSPVSDRQPAALSSPVGRLDVNDALGRAWTIFVGRLRACVGMMALYWAVVIGAMFALGIGIAFAFAMLRDGPVALALVMVVGYATILVVQAFLLAGQMNFFLKVARGDFDADVSKLFTGGRWVLPLVGAMLLATVCIWVASLLLIVPGIIVMLMLSQVIFLIIDRDLGVIEAFRESGRITSGNKWRLLATFLIPLFFLGILAAVPNILVSTRAVEYPILIVGVWFLLQIGFGLFFAPWFSILWAVCYLMMSGQATADQRRFVSSPAAPEPELKSAV